MINARLPKFLTLLLAASFCSPSLGASCGPAMDRNASAAPQLTEQLTAPGATGNVAFRLDLMTDGYIAGGFPSHTDRYAAPDGDKVFVYRIYFDSPKGASEQMKRLLRHRKIKVIRRKSRRNADGQEIGKTILCTVRDKSANEVASLALGTSRNTLFEIWSTSSNMGNVKAMAELLNVL
jgi:hypothetical protein